MSPLKLKYKKLRNNKVNTKLLIVELMELSGIDFDSDHLLHKLYQYGFSNTYEYAVKWAFELCDSGILIFNGWKPEKVMDRVVGFTPVFGLIK